MANRVAAANPRGLDAAVAFYGRPLDAAEVPGIKVPLLLHYAGLDQNINAGIPAFRQALDAAGVRYEFYVYEGVNHAFHNDTSKERYAPEAAKLAWERTIAFLKSNTGVA
jgi:carboxymethylenebutenolidase